MITSHVLPKNVVEYVAVRDVLIMNSSLCAVYIHFSLLLILI